MAKIYKSIISVIVMMLLGFSANAQFSPFEAAEKPDSIRVALVTCYPGSEIYELYGHTALRVTIYDRIVRDDLPAKPGYRAVQNISNFDMAFNYGIFSFSEPNFAYRFSKGVANYCLAYYPFSDFIREYARNQRKVVEQELNLSNEQKHQMLDMLLENAKPENRDYRYNYVLDNCSTRPRDIIEKVVGPSLKWGEPEEDNLTYRQIMHKYDKNYAWEVFGIDLALGEDIDSILPSRAQHFAPLHLMHSLEGATYTDSIGNTVQLACPIGTIIKGNDNGVIENPTPWWLSPITFASIILLLSIYFTQRDWREQTITRWFDATLFILYSIVGCVIFFLIFISTHEATSPNLVGLWLNPLYLIPCALLYMRSAWKLLYIYQIVNFGVLLVLLTCSWTMTQSFNIAFYPLILAMALRQLNFILHFKHKRTVETQKKAKEELDNPTEDSDNE